ncbi:response regulator [Pleurocapsales cyanobacterium LEGE 10410]|nr:response regulator [Pleurocapsales cyanobacterium LEGE 10410]
MNILEKTSQEHILVVDDCIDNLYLMQFILENEGYQVMVAVNGEEALDKIHRCQPDLVLLDMMMPRMNGYEVVNRLREDSNFSLIPVFLVTADTYVSQSAAIAAGADGLLYKPINIEQLLFEVAKILANKQASFYSQD